jgi:hypothetical protein
MEIDDLAILASILAHIRHGDTPKHMLPIGRRWRDGENWQGIVGSALETKITYANRRGV